MGSKETLRQKVLGELDSYMQKNETRSPTYTKHKNKFRVDKRRKYKSSHHKSPRRKQQQENLTLTFLTHFQNFMLLGFVLFF